MRITNTFEANDSSELCLFVKRIITFLWSNRRISTETVENTLKTRIKVNDLAVEKMSILKVYASPFNVIIVSYSSNNLIINYIICHIG